MRWPWAQTKPPKETDVTNRNSVEWAAEAARLTAEQAATAAAIERLTAELGSAILDAPGRVAALQTALAAAVAGQTGLTAAIEQAAQRQATAATEEERWRTSLAAREYLAVASRWLTRSAEVREIEAQLQAVRAGQAPAVAADRETLDRVRSRLAQLALPAIETLVIGSAGELRQRAATLSEQAERATIEDGRIVYSGETIDASTLPPPAAKVDRPPVPITERSRRELERARLAHAARVLYGEVERLETTRSPAEADQLAAKRAELDAVLVRQAELGAA